MSSDNRLAVVVIFFVVVLPALCLEIGARIGSRRIRKAWQKSASANVRAPYKPLEQQRPKPLPTDPEELISDYEDAIYFMARHSLVPAGMTQAEMSSFRADQTRLHADVVRLRTTVLERLALRTFHPPA